MTRKPIGRFATVLTASSLALMLLGVGSVTAATPNWDIDIVTLPAAVAPGRHAGYEITVTNDGPSNINGLSVTVTPLDTPTATPTHVSNLVYTAGGPASCTTTGLLVCQLGTLVARASVTFTAAYIVPAGESGTFDLNVSIRAGTGDTGSDRGGSSRGDQYAESAATALGSTNFDGGFDVNGLAVYQTNPSLGRRNVQSTRLTSPASLIPVTIEDGITTGVTCSTTANAACGRLFGEWSKLNVDDGTPFAAPFKVVITLLGNAVPGGAGADDIVVVHVLDGGGIDVIGDSADEICDSTTGTPTNAECITVTKIGNNYQIVVWLFQNGSIRGGI
ncbi:MAG: hypothetical protein H0V89_13850 [Deltaproteobacteria bacterium]|nr:hypothetical protein [Deltaproteobacteria bacterium]